MRYLLLLLLLTMLPIVVRAEYPANSPVASYGKLQVQGTHLCDERGNPIQLRGVSTHGLQWFGEFVHDKSVKMFAEEWKAEVIRASMYTAPEADGYIDNPKLKEKVIEVVELAEKYGIYCLIDWHHLSDNDPNTYKTESKAFFKEMVTLFKDKKHVLYEICNEPDDQISWIEDIKPYAEELIPVIQDVDEQAIVIVGTPFWCQKVDDAAASPLEGKNIMYTLHFYAGEHGAWVQNKFKSAVTEIPIFATEFGTTMADGDRGVYLNETNHWLRLLHKHKVSWINWSLSDKNEDCAILKPNTSPDADWSDDDLTRSGKFIKDRLINGFSEGPYTITIPEIEHGHVELSPNKKVYNYGDEVTITAIPDEGYKFHSWNGLTSSKNPTTITVGGDFDCWPEILAGNEKIVNGDFSKGEEKWKFVAWGEASAEANIENGTFEAQISSAGKDPWEIQLEQNNLTIEKGKIYRLEFRASADEEREITVNVGMAKAPWDSYSNFGTVTVGPNEKVIRNSFTMSNSTDSNARLFFDLGKNSTANVQLRSISLIDTTAIIPVIRPQQGQKSEIRVQMTPKAIILSIPEAKAGNMVELYSIQGKKLYTTTIEGRSCVIKTATLSLSQGIYFLKVLNKSKVQYHTIRL